MNYKKTFIILLSMFALTALGKKSDTDTGSSSQTEVTRAVTTVAETEPPTTVTEKTTIQTTVKTNTTTAVKSVELKTGKVTSIKSTENTAAATNKAVTDAKSTVKVKAEEKITVDENKSVDTTKLPETTTESVTEPPTEEVTESVSKYDAEFSLDETPVINITSGGDYIVRGYTAEGQIYISTENEEKVEITLDGVDISCSDAPAILVNQAKRCVIKLADGSVNYLRDGGTDKVNDGVIFSNDTLRIKGEGTLEITAGNAHGIASDDDVIIESGKYIINAVKSGIFAHDDITVNGGNLSIYGGTNGIKSKGTVNINGGDMYISGGSKEEKSSIYVSDVFNYTGGNVYAAGNQVTPPSSTPNPYIVLNYQNGAGAGSTVGFVLDGTEKAVMNPHNNFRCVLMLSPDIYIGGTFTAYLDGSASEDFTVAEGQNLFTIE